MSMSQGQAPSLKPLNIGATTIQQKGVTQSSLQQTELQSRKTTWGSNLGTGPSRHEPNRFISRARAFWTEHMKIVKNGHQSFLKFVKDLRTRKVHSLQLVYAMNFIPRTLAVTKAGPFSLFVWFLYLFDGAIGGRLLAAVGFRG